MSGKLGIPAPITGAGGICVGSVLQHARWLRSLGEAIEEGVFFSAHVGVVFCTAMKLRAGLDNEQESGETVQNAGEDREGW